MDEERWLPVVGYEEFYLVSSHGRIQSLDRKVVYVGRWGTACRFVKGKILSPHLQKDHNCLRPTACLTDGNRNQRTRVVQCIVCEAFHGPKPEGAQAAHWDGNTLNNREDNLRWATPKENMDDRMRHGRTHMGASHRSSRLTPDDVRFIRTQTKRGDRARLARHFGISPQSISAIHHGKTWKHVA